MKLDNEVKVDGEEYDRRNDIPDDNEMIGKNGVQVAMSWRRATTQYDSLTDKMECLLET